MIPSIQMLKRIQKALMMPDKHIVFIGDERFVIAHTDEERASIDLEDCELHRYLSDLEGAPVDPDYYIVIRSDEDPSEWTFEPIFDG